MAASVNNIAATFATVPVTSSSSSSSSSSNPHQTKFSVSTSHKSISTSWNLHKPLPRSQTTSLFSLYGPPGPPPISTVHPRTRMISKPNKPTLSVSIGDKLPNVTLSYLNRNDIVKSVTLPSLCKAKKVVLVGVTAPFSPNCTRFVKRVKSARQKGADLIACVAVSDIFVMRAWGESLVVDERVMMLSDGLGELTRTLGVSLNPTSKAYLGLGVRSRRFCVAALNGVITSVDFDGEQAEDTLISTK